MTSTPEKVKRYRVSYSHGIVEDTGQIFPVNASRPMVLADEYDALARERDELRELLRQINEAANKVYQMGDATCRNVLVNIYEISGKVLSLSPSQRSGDV